MEATTIDLVPGAVTISRFVGSVRAVGTLGPYSGHDRQSVDLHPPGGLLGTTRQHSCTGCGRRIPHHCQPGSTSPIKG
ncbi:hypothetical protein PHYC_01709 [Phycisphaerales bacterium]|nr:hypothetical protein PHYC_01709 [Phycisphaerales bacterium]